MSRGGRVFLDPVLKATSLTLKKSYILEECKSLLRWPEAKIENELPFSFSEQIYRVVNEFGIEKLWTANPNFHSLI